MAKDIPEFTHSPRLDGISDNAPEGLERWMKTYSVEAVRVGIEVDRLIVRHPGYVSALKCVDRLFQLGTEMETPHGARIIGSSGTGKAALLRYFVRSVPRSSLFSQGLGVIALRVPARPRTGEFIGHLLRLTRYPFVIGSAKQLYQKRPLVAEALKGVGTRLIWLRKAENLMESEAPRMSHGESKSSMEVIDFLLELVDESQVSLVLSGSEALEKLDAVSAELAARTPTIERLTSFPDDVSWLGFVRSFVDGCKPFDLTFLKDPRVAKRLHMASNGNLRQFKQLITEATMLAVNQNLLTLNQKLMSEAYTAVWGTASPRSNPFA
ncbi:TniB family NTP-binding protein [Hydrogenophaga crocea]|uniref:Uncharacterized protein n=1 Tax=Hydrogenophaga crocea TaxID=2716225 RepID=A0A6G8IHX7_9BURK|nr:TniB family NTP-binding protein [Hydrogenophaga crocea]QIM52741.1 hypothetical protein G9Q37_11585 [Hydrogenophaga crocea]